MLTGIHSQNYSLNMQRVIGMSDDPANQDDFYGAQLSLIYYRALNDQAQALFRTRMREGYTQPVSGTSGQSRTRYYRRLNVHFSLAFGAMSINPAFVQANSGPIRKEGEFLIEGMLLQPWCLSDSEFQAARVVLRDGNIPNLQGAPAKLETARNAVIKSEIVKIISKWLSGGVSGSGIFREVLTAPLRSSVLGALVSVIQDLLKSTRIQLVMQAFDKDEPRRVFLASVGWGEYVAPAAITLPTLPAFVTGVPTATK